MPRHWSRTGSAAYATGDVAAHRAGACVPEAARNIRRGTRSRDQARGGTEIRFDRRHGSDTADVTYPTDDVEQVPGAVHYQRVQPSTFARMVAALALDPAEYVFVDLGAGKGRALVLAAHAGFRRVIGVELSPSLARAATRNVAGFPNVEVRVGDATRLELPAAATVLFLYNPFPPGGAVGWQHAVLPGGPPSRVQS